MTTESNVMEVTAALEELRSQLAALAERMEKLEAQVQVAAAYPSIAPATVEEAAAPQPEAASAATPEVVPPPAEEEIPEEILIVIAAAVAAFLGERAHVRQVRLIRTGAWAQEGRVSIQASHRLH